MAKAAGRKELQQSGFTSSTSGSVYRQMYMMGRRKSADKSAWALLQANDQFEEGWRKEQLEWAQAQAAAIPSDSEYKAVDGDQ